MTILVTGGAGSIGSNVVLDWLARRDVPVITLDKLTNAGILENLASLRGGGRAVDITSPTDLRPLLLAKNQAVGIYH